MANAPNYAQQHFENYISSAQYQSDLIAFINNGGASEDFQSQIDDLQTQIDAITSTTSITEAQVMARISVGV